MLDIRDSIKEIWICPPDCEKDHDEYAVASMFGLQWFDVRKLRRIGLRPSKVFGFGINIRYHFLCRDIQEFAYNIEVPIGINYGLRGRAWSRAVKAKARYPGKVRDKYGEFEWEEKRGLVRPEAEVKAIRKLPGYVYLFKWKGIYKIGMSADVEKRASNFFSGPNLTQPEIIHKVAVQDMRQSERMLHEKYIPYRVEGKREWFRLPKKAVTWICSLRDGELDDSTRNTVVDKSNSTRRKRIA